jgi:hypothetical protein
MPWRAIWSRGHEKVGTGTRIVAGSAVPQRSRRDSATPSSAACRAWFPPWKMKTCGTVLPPFSKEIPSWWRHISDHPRTTVAYPSESRL